MPPELLLASYNVHGCIGLDGHFAPERTRDVIREMGPGGPDAIGLQEIGAWGWGWMDQVAFLARELGYEFVTGPTHERPRGPFGNALLVRGEVLDARSLDLGVPRCEPRAAMDVQVCLAGVTLRIVNTHLGLRWNERGQQVGRLLEGLGVYEETQPLVVMADFNEWLPSATTLRRMHLRFGRCPAIRTFPASRPLLPLDRIWVRPARALLGRSAHRTPLSALASDHLPIVVRLDRDILAGGP